MSLTDRIGARFRAEFASQILVMASGGLLTVVLARLLGPDDYGLLFLAIAVFGALSIFSKLGLAKSGARYVAEYKERDPGQIPHILRVALGYNAVIIVVVGAALLVGHRQLAGYIGEPSLTPFLLLGVLYLAVEALKTYVRLMLQGFEEIELSATVNAIDRGTRLVFAIGFVLLGFGALGALGGYILGYGIASIVGLVVIYRRFYRAQEVAASIEDGLRRRIGSYAVPLTATSTANVLDKRVDTILIGVFLTPVAVSYYTVSKQLIEFVQTPVSALGFTLSPTFGSEKADGNVDRASRIYEEALVHSLLLYVPIAAGIVLVAEPTIELLFGNDYLGAVPVLQILGLYAILQAVTKITSNGLDYLGRAKERAIVKGTTAGLNVVLNVVLIPAIGVVGAAIATVVTYSLYTLANVFIIHQEFDLRIGYILGRLALIVTVTAAMATVVYVAVDFVVGPVTLGVVVALGVAIWGILSVLTGLLDVQKLVRLSSASS